MTLAQLLVVQDHDSAIDRLTHSLTILPEFSVLTMLDDEQSYLETERAVVAEQRHEIEREEKRFEDEAAIVTSRINKENLRLYDGSVTAHKELQTIQDELVTLNRRRAEIEDHVLEAMEHGEPLDTSLGALDDNLISVEQRREQATESLEASQTAIRTEAESQHAQRSEAMAKVDPELVSIYEQSRSDCGGVGICRLIDKTCQGCHLTLPSVEYDRVRKESEGTIVRCGECNRILVR
ncbi:MAG: putative nucleic acid-binding Zn-ribbon protein [Acidimicrobiales bacterium]|jgi:predicted  nucleic acid-binding Zn-ribbon protein